MIERFDLTDSDRELLAAAEDQLQRGFREGCHHVAAALRTGSGEIVSAMHLEASVGRIAVCAEAIALGQALSVDRVIDTIVAVHYADDTRTTVRVIPPCGMCRELVTDYAPEAYVLTLIGDEVVKARMMSLIPGKFIDDEFGTAAKG